MARAFEQRSLPEREERRPLEGVKGLLILLIMFGHMQFVLERDVLRPVYDALYLFHVAGFLLIPFLLPARPLSLAFARDRTVRYGVPFLMFFSLAAALFYTMVLRHQLGAVDALGRYGIGVAVASAKTLDAAAGLKMFWFLPALLTLTLLRGVWAGAGDWGKAALLAAVLLVHSTLGEMGAFKHYVPWGLPIAAFIFPLGLALEALQGRGGNMPRLGMAAACGGLFAALMGLAVHLGMWANLGDMQVYGLSMPGRLAIHDLIMLSLTGTALLLAPELQRVPGLAVLGRMSLPLYLLHPFVNQLLLLAVAGPLGLRAWTQLAVVFPGVVAISLVSAVVLWRMEAVRRVLFPRDWKDFKTGLRGAA